MKPDYFSEDTSEFVRLLHHHKVNYVIVEEMKIKGSNVPVYFITNKE